nr:F0F1 ATP synthase subunit epsilon [Candidatus Bipolaricaulota bacterium]
TVAGEFAVMEGHAPLLAALDRGMLRIKTETHEESFAIRSGAMNVDDQGNVVLLVSEAHRPEEIDAEWIDQRTRRAESELGQEETSWLTWLRSLEGSRG